jgi:uracil-DNA glycosylase
MATSKKSELKKIVEDIEKNDITPELRKGATQLVFGDGNDDADVVFIGEAPGKNEDEQGKPFVGAAGKFLNEMLETIGLKREDIYITNIVKYRPPNNRDPLPEEKKAFWPYLVRQLDVIKPKLVVTLGRHSMEYFLPNQKISAIHGEPKRIQFGERKQVIMPLFHPAAALYNGSLRETLIADFSHIPVVLSKIDN